MIGKRIGILALVCQAIAVAGIVVLASSSSAQGVTVALYHMDESEGSSTMNDSSGNGNDGNISNVTLGVPGHSGTAYEFNDVNSQVIVSSSASLNPGNDDLTLSAWVKPTALPASDSDDLLRKGTAGTVGGEYKMEVLSTGKINCVFQGVIASGSKATLRVAAGNGQPGLVDGSFHRVQCIKTSASVTVMVDSYSKTANFANNVSIANGKALHVGHKAPGVDVYNGVMDEVSIEVTEVPDDPEPTPTPSPSPTPTTSCLGQATTIQGTGGANNITGTAEADVINGLGGNDVIDGAGGNDRICGVGGRDQITGGEGDDTMNGGATADTIRDLSGTDNLQGATGADTLDALDGSPGDTLNGGADPDTCASDPGDTRSSCEITEVPDDPTPTPSPSPTPTTSCLGQTTTIEGTNGADNITGTAEADVINGLGGNDVIDGAGGNDRICGLGGLDQISGGEGDDTMNGGAAADTIKDLSGTDNLQGATGADTLDALDGSPGDTLNGGADPDTCASDTGDTRSSCESSP